MRIRSSLTRCSVTVAALAAIFAGNALATDSNNSDWPIYGGNAMGQRYSTLDQINRENVGQLEQAWRFDAGVEGGLQTSPIVIGRKLFGYTTDQHAIALDGATGELLWRFDPSNTSGQPARGLTYWSDSGAARLFATSVTNLYALDPETGKPIAGFGDGGKIDLRQDLGRNPDENAVFLTSPGIVYKDLIIVGFRTSENPPAPPGDIRAYDVRTGKLRWSFHAIPRPGEAGHETWPQDAWKTAGGANAWAGMALDGKRGIVYVPTGSNEITDIIVKGRGRMPGFPQLGESGIRALLGILLTHGGSGSSASEKSDGRQEVVSTGAAAARMPFIISGYNRFQDSEGYPAVEPPWGTLNAIDLNTGEYLWKIPLGEHPELVARGMENTGSENYGGPIVTSGGLLFIGATLYDSKFRAFDSRTGELLWQAQLPYAGVATPISFSIDGRQYVVIASSGSRNSKGPQGAAYVAFALPAKASR